MPTTPFLLLAIACFSKGSERFYKWTINNKYFGKYLNNYRSGNGIPKHIKIKTLVFLWFSISISVYLVEDIYIKTLLILIAILVSIHILTIKPKKHTN